MEKKAEYQLASNELIAIQKSINSKSVLIDVRAFRGRFKLTEVYFSVRNCPLEIWRMDIAGVDLEENTEYEPFQEATTSNAALSLKWFTDIDAARNWLKAYNDKNNGSVKEINIYG